MDIYRKDGMLSAYGLACGYIQRAGTLDTFRVELYKAHGVYCIAAIGNEYHEYKYSDRLSEAYAVYIDLCNKYADKITDHHK